MRAIALDVREAIGGELQIKTPLGMLGYLDAPELTRAAFADGYFRTGDLARVRPDGRVELVGRATDIISRGGYKIAPLEVEAVLAKPQADHYVVPPRSLAQKPWKIGQWTQYKIQSAKRLGYVKHRVVGEARCGWWFETVVVFTDYEDRTVFKVCLRDMPDYRQELDEQRGMIGAYMTRRGEKTEARDLNDGKSQRAVAAQGATIDLRDSVSATNLSAVGTVRANQAQRQTDIANLEAASHSLDGSQHTGLATLQRINQALLLLLRTQQDESQFAQGQTLQQIVSQKQQQDELKLLFQNAQDYEANYKSKISSSSGSVAKAFTY